MDKNRTGSDMTLSWKLAYGYILVAGGCVILLPLVKAIGLNPNYVGSSWYIIGFYTLFCFSELLTLPVMLSAATTFAPHGFSTTLVSLNIWRFLGQLAHGLAVNLVHGLKKLIP